MQNTFSYVSSLKLVEFLTFVGFATLLFLCLHDLNQAKWAAALLILACFKFFCIVVSPIWGAVAVSALLWLVSMLAQQFVQVLILSFHLNELRLLKFNHLHQLFLAPVFALST